MTKSPQLKGNKRRPAKKRSSFSPWQKLTAQVTKVALKKIYIKRPAKPNAAAPKARQTQLLSLPFGRRAKLVIAVHRSKPRPSKRKPSKTKTASKSTRSFKQAHAKKLELILSSLLVLAGLSGMVFFGLQTVASPIQPVAKPASTSRQIVPQPEKKHFLPRSMPAGLRIADIQLSSSLTTIGTEPDGTIEVPKDYTKAGWYTSSPTPGEAGPAIIVGHLDNIHGAAVFGRLRELVPGQVIEVDRQDGKTARFVIEQTKQFPQDDNFPTGEVYGNTDHAALRLITCGGTFNHLTQRYSENTVIFASLVKPEA